MQDAPFDKNDHAHGQEKPDDTGKPGALKEARRVWREAFGKGLYTQDLAGCPPYHARLKETSYWNDLDVGRLAVKINQIKYPHLFL